MELPTWWDYRWPLLLPSPSPVFLLLFLLIPLLPFLKLPSPPLLCLPTLGLLLKSTEGSNTVAGKGWNGSACQHQTEDRTHKRTREGERIRERHTTQRRTSGESYKAVREETTTFKMPRRRKHTSFTWASWASKGTLTDLELWTSSEQTSGPHTRTHTRCGDTHSCSLGLLVNTWYASLKSVSHASQGKVPVERPGAEKWGTIPQILLHQPVSASGAPAGPFHARLWNPPHSLLCPPTGESLLPCACWKQRNLGYTGILGYWPQDQMFECLNFYSVSMQPEPLFSITVFLNK